jgi:N-acetyl-gamma-glutamyl-phosphate reductase
MKVGALTAASSAGTRLGRHPSAPHSAGGPRARRDHPQTLAGHEVVFLALPHGASAALVAELPDDLVVIDCGADFRLDRRPAVAVTSTAAATPAPGHMVCRSCRCPWDTRAARLCPALIGRHSRVLPTACTLALAPGFVGWTAGGADVVIVAASGTSGAGKSLKPHLLGRRDHELHVALRGRRGSIGTPRRSSRTSAPRPGAHVTVSFTPTLAPMPRGILATCTARAKPGVAAATVRAAWEAAYDDEPFVHLLPQGQWPRTADVLGSNNVHLQVCAGRTQRTGHCRGGSGQPDQGHGGRCGAVRQPGARAPETTGLPIAGVAP